MLFTSVKGCVISTGRPGEIAAEEVAIALGVASVTDNVDGVDVGTGDGVAANAAVDI